MAAWSNATIFVAERKKFYHNLAMARYWKGSHTKHKLQFHVVWIPKYRKRVIRGKMAIRIRRLLYEGCKMNRWYIRELKIKEDHIHMIIQISPKDSIADVINILKGGSSRIIRKEFPELEEFLWGDSLWADGYFAETIGQVDEEVVRKYIRDQ
jgi:putative transposase